MSDVRLAKPDRQFDQCVQHCLQVEGRAADDLEHVGGRGLLLQRLAQLVEQPSILDGDDGLSGEVGEQLNLLGRKWSHLLAVNGKGADELILLKHGHDDS